MHALPSIPLSPLRKSLILSIALVLTIVLRQVDLFTGPELSFSIFYLAPIMAVTWILGQRAGILLSLVSALCWFSADVAQHRYTLRLAPYWNAFVRLAFFVIISYLLAALRRILMHEQGLSRNDPLTGVANRRTFSERLQAELKRGRRYRQPLTLAYVDIDDFKLINDRYGHWRGDHVLQLVAATVHDELRQEDVVARLGGDEFAILLTNTDGPRAKSTLTRIRASLEGVMRHEGLEVGFSVGAVVSPDASCTPRELIEQADSLMYEVKRQGKDAIQCAIAHCPPTG